jgi:hypothetical protein
LICKTTVEPFNRTAMHLLIEDEKGDVENLSLYNFTIFNKKDPKYLILGTLPCRRNSFPFLNENIRKEMSLKGWDFVREKFHYTTLVKNIEHYYQELLDKKKVK